MKKLIATMTLAVMAIASTAITNAAESKEVVYVAGMTGVTWGGCKRDVSSAFGTLKGFQSINIENGEEAGTQKITVVTDGSAEISKEDAIESLGDKASRYVVEEWSVEGAEESESEEKEAA